MSGCKKETRESGRNEDREKRVEERRKGGRTGGKEGRRGLHVPIPSNFCWNQSMASFCVTR